MPALELRHLTKTFTGNKTPVHALQDVSFTMETGTIHGLLGPNGAGKSTMISLLSGASQPTSGTALIEGLDVTQDPIGVKAILGVVPQELVMEMAFTVEEVLWTIAGMYGVPAALRTKRIDAVLEDLELSDKKTVKARTLSGGMRRRLMIAKAIMHQPKLLILDEPTAGVDVALRRKIWELVRRLNQEGTSILFTTHYLEEADALCERITVINKGQIVEDGNLREVKAKYGQSAVRFSLHDQALPPLPGVIPVDQDFELRGPDLAALAAQVSAHYGSNLKTLTAGSASLEDVFLTLTA
jgi:ABC-2 type transport system ATP-binding protein